MEIIKNYVILRLKNTKKYQNKIKIQIIKNEKFKFETGYDEEEVQEKKISNFCIQMKRHKKRMGRRLL
ncbi:hypothetical protein B5F18_09185 [Lachnoclostridium sp. An181]|nr:hypothetical protein B5F18_09185 [Lachnoclostridium sp. An181]